MIYYCVNSHCSNIGTWIDLSEVNPRNCKACKRPLAAFGTLPARDPNAPQILEQIGYKIILSSKEIDKYDMFLDETQAYVQRAPPVATNDLFEATGLTKLNDGTHERSTLDKRRRFFVALAVRITTATASDLIALPRFNGNWHDHVSLKAFLGSGSLVSLYKDAVEEENKSRNYRAAVVFAGYKEFPNYDWRPQQHIIVSGPSGSGKSYGATLVIQELLARGHGGAPQPGSNTRFVSIDGGDARATSQVRKMIIQCAVVLRFRGISDLHSQTSLSVKDKVKAAAKASPNRVHIIEPLTFADPREGWALSPDENMIFSTVVTSKEDVARLGTSRAWYNDVVDGDKSAAWIEINNAKPGCESKEYEGKHFDTGKSSSASALEKYHDKTRRRLYVTVVNHLTFTRDNRVDRDQSSASVRVDQLTTRHNENLQNALQWKSDTTAVQCAGCERAFAFNLRKHHCRKCGDIFCSTCATERVADGLPKVLMCQPCYDTAIQAVARRPPTLPVNNVVAVLPLATNVLAYNGRVMNVGAARVRLAEILGTPSILEARLMKQAFMQFARTHHQDKTDDVNKHELFKEVQALRTFIEEAETSARGHASIKMIKNGGPNTN